MGSFGASGTTATGVGETLFGRTRRELLTILLGRPEQRFFFRELLRAVGGGSGAVQRELGLLTRAGLVYREQEGRQVYYSANRSAPVYPELKALIEKTAGAVDVLRTELGALLREERVSAAFVYGSAARGQQTSGSDVDLMILGEVSLGEVVPMIRAAERRLGREVNPSLFPLGEFRKGIRRGSSFLKRVAAGPKLFLKGDDRELARLAR